MYPSPMVQSKKRSQYQYTGGTRAEAGETDDSQTTTECDTTRSSTESFRLRTPTAGSRLRAPQDRSRVRTPSYAPPATAPSMAHSTLSSQSSARSQFSDSPDERDAVLPADAVSKNTKANSRKSDMKAKKENSKSVLFLAVRTLIFFF